MKRSVLYLQYTNPANYPPLEHSGKLLLAAGCDVRFFGVQSEGESRRLVFPEALARRVMLWKHQPPGGKQKFHFIAFTFAALWRVFRQRPAWVYCSDLMSCPAAWLIGKFTQSKVLYHEHDSPEVGKQKAETLKTEKLKAGNKVEMSAFQNVSVSEFKEVSTFQRFLLWTRKRVGREADLVVLPNERRLKIFEQTTGRKNKSLCVFNCPRKEEVSLAKQPKINGNLRILFHGSLNYQQPPPILLDVMSKFNGMVTLTVAGYPVSSSRDCMKRFQQKASSLCLEKNVKYVGALPRYKLLEIVRDNQVGLALFPLESDSVNLKHLTGASNKPFDYLACGLALLVSARPDWEEMFVQPGYGLSCNPNDADFIAEQLRWFLDHPVETRQMGERGRQRILAEWNYEKQFEPVLNQIEAK